MVHYSNGDYGSVQKSARRENADSLRELNAERVRQDLEKEVGRILPTRLQLQAHELLSNESVDKVLAEVNRDHNPAVGLHFNPHCDWTDSWGKGEGALPGISYKEAEQVLLICGHVELAYQMGRARAEQAAIKYYSDAPDQLDRVERELKEADQSFARFMARLESRDQAGLSRLTPTGEARIPWALSVVEQVKEYGERFIAHTREETLQLRVSHARKIDPEELQKQLADSMNFMREFEAKQRQQERDPFDRFRF